MLSIGEIPSSLFNISSMRVLNLEGNKLNGSLTEEMFRQLPLLEYFYMARNQFVASIPKSISNWTMLEELYLGGNSFTGMPLLHLYIYLSQMILLI